jgi:hypothetical protein
LNSAANGFAAHRESGRKLALARQLVTHPEDARGDMRRQLVADLFPDGALDDASLEVGEGRKQRFLG